MRLGKKQIGLLCGALLFGWSDLLDSPFSAGAKGPRAAARLAPQSAKRPEQERERAYNRQQFKKNFQDLQVLSQNLLKDHEAGRLTPGRLAKDTKSINKCAKALRSLTALGGLAEPQVINKAINTPKEYDESIRLLAKRIRDFAHNPVHQNAKIFNTAQAQQAQTDLLAIIDLSKAIESKAKGYVTGSAPAQ